MNLTEAVRENFSELISVASSDIPRPLTPMSSRGSVFHTSKNRIKPVATKTMIKHALKALSSNGSRKVFSWLALRKYIMQNYLPTETKLKPRLNYIKTFVRNALESGELCNHKGYGLIGSFRVPSKSCLLGARRKIRKLKKGPMKSPTKRSKQVTANKQRKTKISRKKRIQAHVFY